MAVANVNKADIVARLMARFRNVPSVDTADATEWVETAVMVLGKDEPFTQKESLAVLYYAVAEGARNIALRVAHYFNFSDGDESVDKKGLSDYYLKMASEYERLYERQKGELIADTKSRVVFAKRADR